MRNKADNVNTGGGSMSIGGNAIGGRNSTLTGTIIGGDNIVHGDISDSLNVSQTSNRQEFLAALRQLQDELDKATDLPPDEADDLKTDLDAAVKAIDREKPNKERVVEKLTRMQKILDGLKGTVSSALAIGKLVGQVLAAAHGVPL